MKKLYLLVILLVGGSCQQNEEIDAPVNPYAAQIEVLHDLLAAEMSRMAGNPDFTVIRANTSSKEFRFSTEGAVDLNVPLSSEQIGLSNTFINDVWNGEGTADIHAIVDSYENQVAASSLTEEQKYELFSIGESVRVTAEFIDNGGAGIIYDHVLASLPPDEQIPVDEANKGGGKGGKSCIDVKDIMQGAVLGGFTGAATGGYVGCTVGTFTIPVVGTATGCVGGAVFGFASGFFGATIGSLAQQVIFTCLMKANLLLITPYDPNFEDLGPGFSGRPDLEGVNQLILNPIGG